MAAIVASSSAWCCVVRRLYCRRDYSRASPQFNEGTEPINYNKTSALAACLSDLSPAPRPEFGSQDYAEQDPGIASRCCYLPGPLDNSLSETYSDSPLLDFQEVFLLRHLIGNLGPLVTVSLEGRTAQLIELVRYEQHGPSFYNYRPQQPVLWPVLRYAIYTECAKHPIRLAHCKGGPGLTASVDRMPLRNVTPETATTEGMSEFKNNPPRRGCGKAMSH
ncbi:uncharacterized protein DSM5745_06814 [Aspergillus mulundensis]|uniref:Uncharacterized protein n=1 Tax=Aspergillus mulundensis TaxID=1810919 RepID=A0A3D8RRW9_9EURO|nr:hypothetical protein DSM5745_06814 [Aspergillus mulundensis]RDW76822.1 hypothetical protein DSM5745_06814 [Aspergillus mulundensis]